MKLNDQRLAPFIGLGIAVVAAVTLVAYVTVGQRAGDGLASPSATRQSDGPVRVGDATDRPEAIVVSAPQRSGNVSAPTAKPQPVPAADGGLASTAALAASDIGSDTVADVATDDDSTGRTAGGDQQSGSFGSIIRGGGSDFSSPDFEVPPDSTGGGPLDGDEDDGSREDGDDRSLDSEGKGSKGGDPKFKGSKGGDPKDKGSKGGDPKFKGSKGGDPKFKGSKGGDPKVKGSKGGSSEGNGPKDKGSTDKGSNGGGSEGNGSKDNKSPGKKPEPPKEQDDDEGEGRSDKGDDDDRSEDSRSSSASDS